MRIATSAYFGHTMRSNTSFVELIRISFTFFDEEPHPKIRMESKKNQIKLLNMNRPIVHLLKKNSPKNFPITSSYLTTVALTGRKITTDGKILLKIPI